MASSLGAPLAAQDQSSSEEAPPIVIADQVRDSDITVVASGGDALIAQTGQPVSIIGEGEIDLVQGGDIARIVERLPGVTLTRNGGVGSFTGMRVRGAGAEQLLVLVDGVRVADTASPASGFDFGTLLPAGIGKIELLRGSNSTIWGSQAMGGVLAVQSHALTGAEASVEYGGPKSLYATGGAGGSTGPLDFGIDAALIDSDGISAAADGSEPDGLRHWQVSGRARLALSDGFSLRTMLGHADARLDIDGYPAPDYIFADTAEYQDMRRTTGLAGLDYRGSGLVLHGSFSLSGTARELYDPAFGSDPVYSTNGHEEHAQLRGKWDISGDFRLHFGAEREWSRFSTLYDAEKSAVSSGTYAQLGYDHGGFLFNAGLRLDDHEGFGSALSFGADGAVQLGDGWRIRASYGEGFKAPSLFQLLSDYGNAALQPERSRSYDIGIEKGDRNGWLQLALSAFRRDSEDLIDFVSCWGASSTICSDRPYGTYDNVGSARAQGIEAEIALQASDALRLQGAYSYVEAVDRTAGAANEGNALARRPRHALTLSADWTTPLAGLALGGDVRVVSGSFDDAANLVPLGGYQVLTLRASMPVSEQVELFGRIENVTDTNYQTVAGYGTPGRSAYIGARARF